jgi:ATP/maltotriose-dependent transcriptional regulator MalT
VDDQVGEVLSLMAQSTKLSRAVRSIYMKLGVSNRRLAVLTAHDRGLLNNSVR